jgi:hypothetical protein
VIEPKTELLPVMPLVAAGTAAPPAPTVTVIGEPAVTAKPVAVL